MSGIVFIRHAATDMAGTFCGHSDPPVNAIGRRQIETMIESLSGERWDAIYSSDLRRAVTTAEALAKTSALEVIMTPHLREIHFGEWEGLTWEEIERRDPAYAHRWLESFPAVAAPAGESFQAFEDRVLKEVDQLIQLAADRRIAVVTHGGVMRVILCRRLGYSQQQAWEATRPYCSSFVFEGVLASEEARR